MESLPDPVIYQDDGNEQYQQGGNEQFQQVGNEQFQQVGNDQYQQGGNEQYQQGGNEQYQQGGNQQYGPSPNPNQQDNMDQVQYGDGGEQFNQNYQNLDQITNQDVSQSTNQDASQNPDIGAAAPPKAEPVVAEKKPDGWREGDWKCSVCGDHQFASRLFCRRCDAPKPRPNDPSKVYCGNLKPETSEEALRNEMSKFGEIDDCYILGPKGNSKGFGFVVYKDNECIKAAMAAEVILDGNKIKVEKSMSRREDGGGGSRGGRAVNNSRLYIGGVGKGTTESQMKEYLLQFGEITDIAIMGERGFGFVTFAESADVQGALNAKLELNGNSLELQRARPKRDDSRPPPWARYGGGGGWGGYDDYRGGYENYYRGRDRGGYGGYENYHRGGGYGGYDRGYRGYDRGGYDRGGYDRGGRGYGYDRGYSRRDMSPRRSYRR